MEIDLQLFADYLEAHSAKPNTIKSYLTSVRSFNEYHVFVSLGKFHKFINTRRKELAQHSFNLMLTSLKACLRFIDLYEIEISPKVTKEIKNIKRYSNPIPVQPRRAYTREETNTLLQEVDIIPWRWQAIWSMLSFGMRASELRQLKLSDIDLIENQLTIRAEISKSSRARIIPISNRNKRVIQSWYKSKVLGTYYIEREGKKARNKTVSQRSYSHWKSVDIKIGFDILAHNLRYTFATNLYRKTNDIVLVQKMLGHADPSITSIYLKLTREDFNTRFLEADLSFI